MQRRSASFEVPNELVQETAGQRQDRSTEETAGQIAYQRVLRPSLLGDVRARVRDVSTDLYEFSDDPQTPWDVEVANHFTSTHPESVFRRTLTIQRSGRHERVILRSSMLTRYRDGWMTEEPIDRAQLPRVARELFGVELPDGPLVFDMECGALASS